MLNQAVSDQIIAVAYFSMPVWLIFSARARRLARRANGQSWMLLLFGAFIFSCGLGHEIDAYFEFSGLCAASSRAREIENWITAVLSALTTGLLLPLAVKYITAFTAPLDAAEMDRRITDLEKRFPDAR